MSFTTSTGKTSVTGNVSSVPVTLSPILVGSNSRSTAGTTTIVTCTAGKVAKILSIQLSSLWAANSISTNAVQLNGVTHVLQSGFAGATPSGYATSVTCKEFVYGQGPSIAAGQTITLVTAHANYASCVVHYVEEDA